MNCIDHPVVWDADGELLWNMEVLHAIVATGKTVPVLAVKLSREQYDTLIALGIVKMLPGNSGSLVYQVADHGQMRDQVELWRAAGELQVRD